MTRPIHDRRPARGVLRRDRRDVRVAPANVAEPGDLRGPRLRRRPHRRGRRARLAGQRHRGVPRSRWARPCATPSSASPTSRRATSSRRTIPSRAAAATSPTSRWSGRSSSNGELVAFAARRGTGRRSGGRTRARGPPTRSRSSRRGCSCRSSGSVAVASSTATSSAIIGANSRLPDMTIGDLTAFAACLEVAERRVLEVCRRYGVDDVTAAMARGARSERGAVSSGGRAPAARRVRGRGLHRRGRARQRAVPDPRARRDRRRARRRRLHRHPSPGAGAGELHAERSRLRASERSSRRSRIRTNPARTRGSARSR